MRNDGRANDQLRPVKITRDFTQAPAGSVLWQQGKTIVLCTASVTQELPPFFKESRPGGWITAEYVMLPGSTPQRKGWPKTGHTDSRGSRKHNMKLSAARAESVRQHLVGLGIDSSRMDAKGYGPDQPIETNKTAAGREKNRRVEFFITQQ